MDTIATGALWAEIKHTVDRQQRLLNRHGLRLHDWPDAIQSSYGPYRPEVYVARDCDGVPRVHCAAVDQHYRDDPEDRVLTVAWWRAMLPGERPRGGLSAGLCVSEDDVRLWLDQPQPSRVG